MGLFDRSLNKVILIGNLGKDPEVRSFQNGGRVCNLTIATSESWKDKESSEIRQKTEWHRIVVYNEKLIELIEKYIHKGSKIHVEGQLETRKYTDEASGVDKYTTEVVLKPFRGDLTILDSKSENNQNSQETITEDKEIKDQKSNKSSVNELATELDDDIPF
ncbi:MAG: Single-stranded DNA-binding protein [Alphaproteobacteria bacterium MarineAlpha9_Bin1]|nr:MAG: Single-stranded DNA-binding protein [Alphaproteobacteria bacterium MarineAlpha9_Bin1]